MSSKYSPQTYVQNDTDSLANVREKIKKIKEEAKKSSKIVDKNGKP